jgi:uncharacterized small protein (DUF1192 family)
MSAMTEQEAIDLLVRQIDENRERIGTLEAENARLTRDLAAARASRDDLAAKVFHATRRGW